MIDLCTAIGLHNLIVTNLRRMGGAGPLAACRNCSVWLPRSKEEASMSTVGEVVLHLARDRHALQSFLGDSDAWLAEHCSGLSDLDRAECLRIAVDLHRLLEYRCVAAFERSPESAFARGQKVGRRRLMLQACSATLAAVFAGFFAKHAVAAGGTGADNTADPLASNTVCNNHPMDSGCTNTLECRDEDMCKDENCENTGTCADIDCRDNRCTNHDCNDSLCADDTYCTNRTCNDDACMDIGGPAPDRCTNFECVDNPGCIDDRCTNTQICEDNPYCGDGDCNDQQMCSPPTP